MPEIAFARTWPKPGRAAGLAAIALGITVHILWIKTYSESSDPS